MNNNLFYNYVLTADIGGSHITAALCDLDSHALIDGSKARAEFNSQGPALSILNSWITVLRQVLIKADGLPVKLGLAMPGPFDYQEGISYITGLNKYESLYGLNIKQILAEALEIEADGIRFRNDAEAAIAGEAFAGAAADCDNLVIGITLGTGFGTARHTHGHTTDLNWGSMPFGNSIADDYLSTRWFLKRYHQLAGTLLPGVKELANLAAYDDHARQVFNEFGENLKLHLGACLGNTVPDMLVICGNIAKSHRYFLPALKKYFKDTRVELGYLGEDAALLGAAALFKHASSLTKSN